MVRETYWRRAEEAVRREGRREAHQMIEETYCRREVRKQGGRRRGGRRTNGDLTIIKLWKRHIGGGRKGSREKGGQRAAADDIEHII